MKKILQVFALLIVFNSVSANESGEDLINAFFQDLQTLTANFEQAVQNAQLNTTENAAGELWIERPGKFRWNYKKPYLQEIVSDGEKIWIFDADLEQVTVKKVNKTLGNTPALLLSSHQPLSESFTILDVEKNTLTWVALKPKDSEAGFNSILLGFNNNQLEKMILEDNLGQSTHLIFTDLKRNRSIDQKLFQFVPPKGADIFDNSQ